MKLLADTNIILRLLTQDDAEQFRHISNMLESRKYELIITAVTITEACWILRNKAGRYKLNNETIGNIFLDLLAVENILPEDEHIRTALHLFTEVKNVDFVDCYLSAKSKNSNTAVTTWDNDFRKLSCEYYKPSDL